MEMAVFYTICSLFDAAVKREAKLHNPATFVYETSSGMEDTHIDAACYAVIRNTQEECKKEAEPMKKLERNTTPAFLEQSSHQNTERTVTPQAPPGQEPLLVRVEEAARMLSLSRSTIYEMMGAGDLPYVRHGMARRIPTAAIRAWVVDNMVNA